MKIMNEVMVTLLLVILRFLALKKYYKNVVILIQILDQILRQIILFFLISFMLVQNIKIFF